MRGSKCKYRHADTIDPNVRDNGTGKVIFCRNYQRGKCNLPNCKYLHYSRADEEFYFQTGALPTTMDTSFNPFTQHAFPAQMPVNSTEQTPSLPPLTKPYSTSSLPVGSAISNPIQELSSIPISNEQPLPTEYYKHSSPKADSPFSPTSECVDTRAKNPPQKSFSHSTQSITEIIGGKQEGTTRSRRWSIDNTDPSEDVTHKLSPLSLTPRDEAFKNPEIDLLKIKLLQLEDQVKSLEFYNDILREQNSQLKQQVKRYENPFSPIYKPIIKDDSDAQTN